MPVLPPGMLAASVERLAIVAAWFGPMGERTFASVLKTVSAVRSVGPSDESKMFALSRTAAIFSLFMEPDTSSTRETARLLPHMALTAMGELPVTEVGRLAGDGGAPTVSLLPENCAVLQWVVKIRKNNAENM